MRYIHLRLTQKPAERLHGLDLSRARVGDIVVVTPHSAVRLIAGRVCGGSAALARRRLARRVSA